MARGKDLRGERVIDSRDVIARIKELDNGALPASDNPHEHQSSPDGCPDDCVACEWERDNSCELYDEDEAEELKALQALEEEANGCADWRYGESLILDSYFEEYARQFADDIGAIKDDAQWPATCIDWKRAAEELQQDYTSVTFGDDTYWIRS